MGFGTIYIEKRTPTIKTKAMIKIFLRATPVWLLMFWAPPSFSDNKVLIDDLVKLRKPSQGSTFSQKRGASRILFEWNLKNQPDKKVLIQISKSPTFDRIIREKSIKGRTYLWRNSHHGDFYWRVALMNDNGTLSEFTRGQQFTILGSGKKSKPKPMKPIPAKLVKKPKKKPKPEKSIPLQATVAPIQQKAYQPPPPPIPSSSSGIVLRYPVNGALINQRGQTARVNFSWSPHQGAKRYRLQVSKSPRFRSLEVSKKPRGPSFTWYPSVIGKYFWRVAALDQAGHSIERSRTYTVVITLPRSRTHGPASQQISKVDAEHPLQFTWDTINPLYFYRFKISKERRFNQPLINTDLKTPQYTVTNLPPGRYYWKVGFKPLKVIPIQYSKVKTIHVTSGKGMVMSAKAAPAPHQPSPMKPTTPTLQSPQHKATIPTYQSTVAVPFQWTKDLGQGVVYKIEVFKGPSYKTSSTHTSSKAQYGIKLPAGTYKWRVQSRSGSSVSPWSSPRMFQVKKETRRLTTNSPEPNAVTSGFEVSFDWDKLDICQQYRLVVSSTENFSHILLNKHTQEGSFDHEFDDEDSYYWYVSCKAAGGITINSKVNYLKINLDDS